MTTLRQRWHHNGAGTSVTPGVDRPSQRAPVRPSGTPRQLAPRHLQVLRAISDGRVTRDLQYGDVAPWMLDGEAVSWSVTVLAVHGYIVLKNTGLGPALLTGRGRTELNGRD